MSHTKKIRHFCFIVYCTPYDFLDKLTDKTSVSRYIAIYHDKDLKSDGSPKEPHYHIIVTFQNPHFVNGVRKICPELRQELDCTILVEPVFDKCQSFLYLTHETEEAIDEGKPLYDSNLLLSNDLPYYQAWALTDPDLTERSTEQFLIDMLTLSPFAVALKWGRDYIKNFGKYNDFLKLNLQSLSESDIETLPTNLQSILKEYLKL